MESTFNLGFLLKFLLKARGLLNLKTDHDGLREWLRELMALFDFLADQTAFEIDDDVVEFLATVVNDDASYDAFYVLIEKALDKFGPVKPDPVKPEPIEPVEPILQAFVRGEVMTVSSAGCVPGVAKAVDIAAWTAVIVQIVQLILQLINSEE